jgi:predicted  nucleic acid-binding Zn-ribbon protein
MNSKIEEFSPQVEKMKKEIDDVQEKFTRSEKRKKASNDKVKRMKTDNTTLDLEINLFEQKTKNQFLMNAVSILCNEIPELKNAITGSLQEKGISIPSRPNSEKISNL